MNTRAVVVETPVAAFAGVLRATVGGTSGTMAYAQLPLAPFVCAHVKAPVAPAVAFRALAWAIEVSVPPVERRSALAVSDAGEVAAWVVTATSGELATTKTT